MKYLVQLALELKNLPARGTRAAHDSRATEFGMASEACHGGGKEHIGGDNRFVFLVE